MNHSTILLPSAATVHYDEQIGFLALDMASALYVSDVGRDGDSYFVGRLGNEY